MTEDTVTVTTDGIYYLEHRRRGLFANFDNLLELIDACRQGALDTGHETYTLDKFREALIESAALRKASRL